MGARLAGALARLAAVAPRCAPSVLLPMGALLLTAGAAVAQAPGPARLGADVPLTLRPTDATRRLSRSVARTLALRLDVEVAVGEDAPPEILEAVPAGHLAIGHAEGQVLLVLAGPEAQVYRSEVAVHGDGADAVRSVALAIEALRDAALDGPPAGSASRRTYTVRSGQSVEWTYLEPEGGIFGPRPDREALATPLIALGLMLGLSTERLTVIAGPRIVLGLCLAETCVSLEGDLPVLPDESTSCDGRVIQYRPVNLGLRLSLRPVTIDDFSFAFDFGLLTRFGVANLVGVDVDRVVSDFGLRSGLELALRLGGGPFELYFEVGADIHTSPGAFVRMPRPPPGMEGLCDEIIERILVEDIVTTWSVLGVRLRPR